MTISSTTRKASYSGNGSTTAFSVSFKYLTKSDIVVELIVDSTGVTTTQVLDTDYSLTSPGDSGTVTMTTAPATGETLLISRQMSIVQETDYVENDPFPANTHEEALDRLTMVCQELDESIKRALALPLSSTTSDLSVPEPVAERFLGWNSAGTALENKTIADASTITLPLSLANGGTGSTSASEARTSLGVDSELSDYSVSGLEVSDTGTANAHVLNKNSTKETFTLKQCKLFYPVNVTNTGAVTVDVSLLLGESTGTTIKDLVDLDGNALSSGMCKSGGFALIAYNETDDNFQLLVASPSSVTKHILVHSVDITATSSQSITANTPAEITGLSVTLTPQSANSKFLLMANWNGEGSSTSNHDTMFGFKRDSSYIGNPAPAGSRPVGRGMLSQGYWDNNASSTMDSWDGQYLDEPNTTNAITYKVFIRTPVSQTMYNNRTVSDGSTHERATSSLIILEIT